MKTYNYQNLFKEYEDVISKAFKEALELFPSKHLVNDDSAWFEMIEKQRDYQNTKTDEWLTKLKSKYNFTKEEWEKLVSKLNTEFLTKCNKHKKLLEEKRIKNKK